MKIIHISDNKYNITSDFLLGNKVEDTIEEIRKNHSDTELFIINASYKSENVNRVDNEGLLLLKYLRLYSFNQHCVLYSFLSREQLISQDLKNLIIFSKGVSFVQLPSDLMQLDYQNLSNKKAPEDMSEYFKAEYRLPDDRHFFANWWGVMQLWKVQRAIDKIAGSEKQHNIEKQLFGKSLEEMNSYNGLVARYIKGFIDEDIEQRLKIISKERSEFIQKKEKNRTQYQKELEKLTEKESEFDKQLQLLEEIEYKENVTIWGKIKNLFSLLPNPIAEKINEINIEKELIENEKKEIDNSVAIDKLYKDLVDLINEEKEKIYEKRRQINYSIRKIANEITNELSFSSENFTVEKIRENLKNKQPKIVFVDDQAEDGWSNIFQKIIYGGASKIFFVLSPNKQVNEDTIANSIVELVKVNNANLLILDLRLKGEQGNKLKLGDISGIKVLKVLKERKLDCPILINTASNKIWSYKEAKNLGAMAFWIKEGLDTTGQVEDSIENYLRFLDLVHTLSLSTEISFLYKFVLKNIKYIETTETSFWWEVRVDRRKITEILYQAYEIFEHFLKIKIENSQNVTIEEYLLSLILTRLSEIFEIIHPQDQDNFTHISERLKTDLGDRFYNTYRSLIHNRNNAVHSLNISFTDLKRFCQLLFEYLCNDQIQIEELEDGLDPITIPQENKNLVSPEDGIFYESEIESVHSRNSYMFFIKNPLLDLQGGKTCILLDKRRNMNISNIELHKGMRVRFSLRIQAHANNDVNYFANDAQLIE